MILNPKGEAKMLPFIIAASLLAFILSFVREVIVPFCWICFAIFRKIATQLNSTQLDPWPMGISWIPKMSNQLIH